MCLANNNTDTKYINYVMGFLPGWWLGEEDNRPDEPYVGRERWAQELVQAGFQEPEAYVIDAPAPYHNSAGIMAAPAVKVIKPSVVTLLCHSTEGPYFNEVKNSIEAQGISVEPHLFGDVLPGQDVVSILDLQEATVHELTEVTFGQLIDHLKALESNLLWVTKSAQVTCQDPRSAMSLGLARTARSELAIKIYTVEIDNKTPESEVTNAVAQLLLHIQTVEPDGDMDPDWEYAIVEGETAVPRMHWQTVSQAFTQECEGLSGAIVKKLGVKTPGLLHTMGWHDTANEAPGQGQVVVETKAVGVNFRVSLY
jgi:hypothetical protein